MDVIEEQFQLVTVSFSLSVIILELPNAALPLKQS